MAAELEHDADEDDDEDAQAVDEAAGSSGAGSFASELTRLLLRRSRNLPERDARMNLCALISNSCELASLGNVVDVVVRHEHVLFSYE